MQSLVSIFLPSIRRPTRKAQLLTSNFVLPASIFWNAMPTPSMTARRTAQPIAPFLAVFHPPRIARLPPVKKPATRETEISDAFIATGTQGSTD